MHDDDAVGHDQSLLLIVGHEQEGDAEPLLKVLQLHLHALAQLEVERAERLVEQQHLGLVGDGAGERDALLLAAGHLGRQALGIAAMPTVSSACATMPAMSDLATPLRRGPKATLSRTVRWGNSA